MVYLCKLSTKGERMPLEIVCNKGLEYFSELLLVDFLEYDFEYLIKFINEYDMDSFVDDFFVGKLFPYAQCINDIIQRQNIIGNLILCSGSNISGYIDKEKDDWFMYSLVDESTPEFKDKMRNNFKIIDGTCYMANNPFTIEEMKAFPNTIKATAKYYVKNIIIKFRDELYSIVLDRTKIIEYISDKYYQINKRVFLDKDKNISEGFMFKDIFSMCYWAVSKVILSDIKINVCENCGKLFIPTVRKDEIYCDRIFKGDRTCKNIGYENKINSDEIMKAYRTAYKTKNAYKNRNMKNNINVEDEFKHWVTSAKVKLAEAQEGKITTEEFKTWLNIH